MIFDNRKQDLPRYTIRISQKAKYLRLKITAESGLEVIVPKNYDHKRIPEIVRQKQAWVEKATQKIQAQRQNLRSRPTEILPTQLIFKSIDQSWQIEYISTTSSKFSAIEQPHNRLVVSGDITDLDSCRELLRQWIARKGKQILIPWLKSVSQSIELPFNQATVRGQKTRWASCSIAKDISINYKLLFIAAPLVHYVFVHELCHTIQMNHSAKFWALVGIKEPSYQELDRTLRQTWQDVPSWI